MKIPLVKLNDIKQSTEVINHPVLAKIIMNYLNKDINFDKSSMYFLIFLMLLAEGDYKKWNES